MSYHLHLPLHPSGLQWAVAVGDKAGMQLAHTRAVDYLLHAVAEYNSQWYEHYLWRIKTTGVTRGRMAYRMSLRDSAPYYRSHYPLDEPDEVAPARRLDLVCRAKY